MRIQPIHVMMHNAHPQHPESNVLPVQRNDRETTRMNTNDTGTIK